MKCFSTIFLPTLLGGVLAANSKLNQYKSISDCHSDSNIISHASPVLDSCHTLDSNTTALYLVVGSGAAGAGYQGYTDSGCSNIYRQQDVPFPRGHCISVPSGTESLTMG